MYTDRQIDCALGLSALVALRQSTSAFQVSKYPTSTFFELTNSGHFDLGASLSEQVGFKTKDKVGS